MSLFEDSRFRWRETYFIQFPSENRPRGRQDTPGDFDCR